MSVLAFFPWFALPAPVTIGGFRLTPHRVGASLEAQPRLVDALLAPFQEPGGGPVDAATLVHADGRSPIDDLTPAEEAGLFRLADAIGFGALARRGFFDAGPYLNRDHLVVVVRRFTGSDPRAVQVIARRRDGHRWVSHGVGTFRFTRPPHAPRLPRWELDTGLVAALLEGFSSAHAGPLREAVAAFLAASGDADGTSPAQELLSMAWAVGRLVEARGDEELPARLTATLAPHLSGARVPRRLATLRRLEAEVDPRSPPSTSIAEAWARDLLRARQAAGGLESKSYWSAEAHLLLGAHLVPLLVQARLAAAGLRPLAAAERGGLLAFAYLAALRDPFARRRSLAARNPQLWRRALEVAARQRARLELAEVLERSRGGAGEAP